VDVKGKSTLLGFEYKLVGFGFARNPENTKRRMQLTFFRQESNADLYLICLSNVTRQQVGVNTIQLKAQLGECVGPEELFIFVQRSIEGASYEQFKKIINDMFENIAWH
jgi:hypothetical protein